MKKGPCGYMGCTPMKPAPLGSLQTLPQVKFKTDLISPEPSETETETTPLHKKQDLVKKDSPK